MTAFETEYVFCKDDRFVLTHLIPPVTKVTVKTVFIYKALKTLLTGVLVTSCKYGKNKGSQLNMWSFVECRHRVSKHVDGRWDNSEFRYTI